MYSKAIISLLPFVTLVHSHGVILKAVGSGGPDSQGFVVNDALARNCTTISPCQLDATIIRDAEITQNIVNGCGRTELTGNIDVGEETENELAANRVTQVTKGSTIAVTIHQVNADGAGPYTCDLDQSSNAGTFEALTVSNNVPGTNGLSQAKFEQFVINVQLPEELNCFGASTGDICTVRCRNNAVAGPFGGCFAVQQTDGTGRTNSSAAAVTTKQNLSDILAQVEVNKEDLDAAIKANQIAGLSGQDGGAAAISALGTATSTAATATSTAATGNNNNGNGNGRGNGRNRNGNNNNANNNAATNAGNGNAATNAGNGNAATNAGNGNGNGRNRNGNNNNNKKRGFSFFS